MCVCVCMCMCVGEVREVHNACTQALDPEFRCMHMCVCIFGDLSGLFKSW